MHGSWSIPAWMGRAFVVLTFGLSACGSDDPVSPEKPVGGDPVTDALRALSITTITHPAVWNAADAETYVHDVEISGNRTSYTFLVTTATAQPTSTVGQTETESIRPDYSKVYSPGFWATDLTTFSTFYQDPAYMAIGSADDIALSIPFSNTAGVDFGDNPTGFAGIDRGPSDTFSEERNFYIVGNVRPALSHPVPYVASLITTWSPFMVAAGNLNTFTFFDSLAGVEFSRIRYQSLNKILYILGYDRLAGEFLLLALRDEDINKNNRHDEGDAYEEVWRTRLAGVTIRKDLSSFVIVEDKLYIAGTTTTSKGDQAGILLVFDALTGTKFLETKLDYSDNDDGFIGITQSGENLFAYGYSHRIREGSRLVKSNGWAVRLARAGMALSNYVYQADGAVIQFTAALGGYKQSNWNEEGYVVLAGARQDTAGYAAFAAEVYHRYK